MIPSDGTKMSESEFMAVLASLDNTTLTNLQNAGVLRPNEVDRAKEVRTNIATRAASAITATGMTGKQLLCVRDIGTL